MVKSHTVVKPPSRAGTVLVFTTFGHVDNILDAKATRLSFIVNIGV